MKSLLDYDRSHTQTLLEQSASTSMSATTATATVSWKSLNAITNATAGGTAAYGMRRRNESSQFISNESMSSQLQQQQRSQNSPSPKNSLFSIMPAATAQLPTNQQIHHILQQQQPSTASHYRQWILVGYRAHQWKSLLYFSIPCLFISICTVLLLSPDSLLSSMLTILLTTLLYSFLHFHQSFIATTCLNLPESPFRLFFPYCDKPVLLYALSHLLVMFSAFMLNSIYIHPSQFLHTSSVALSSFIFALTIAFTYVHITKGSFLLHELPLRLPIHNLIVWELPRMLKNALHMTICVAIASIIVFPFLRVIGEFRFFDLFLLYPLFFEYFLLQEHSSFTHSYFLLKRIEFKEYLLYGLSSHSPVEQQLAFDYLQSISSSSQPSSRMNLFKSLSFYLPFRSYPSSVTTMFPNPQNPAFPTVTTLLLHPITTLTNTLIAGTQKDVVANSIAGYLPDTPTVRSLSQSWLVFKTGWRIYRIFQNSRITMYSAEILVNIIAASLEEDTTGSAQQLLEFIITTLVDCLLALEQFDRYITTTIYKDQNSLERYSVNKHSQYIRLASVLENSIDRILTVIQPYIDQFHWPPKTLKMLERFKF